MTSKFWIPGVPAPFATRGEKIWKSRLAERIPECNTNGEEAGVVMRFYLPTLRPQGQPLDVDNLCDPVFSILVGRKLWFRGTRPAIHWWQASKNEAARWGCEIEISDDQERLNPFQSVSRYIMNDLYEGNLPFDARNEFFAQWADQHGSKLARARGEYIVRLRFGDTYTNIGEIATGPVKATIDCLWPVLGGQPGKPQDWRIRTLQVEKFVPNLPSSSVYVEVAQT